MKKGIVLVIVIGIALLIILFASIGIRVMTQQAFLAEGKIKRIRAYYAARAGLVRAHEQLQKGISVNNATIGLGIPGYGSSGILVNITVGSNITSGSLAGCRPVNATVSYNTTY